MMPKDSEGSAYAPDRLCRYINSALVYSVIQLDKPSHIPKTRLLNLEKNTVHRTSGIKLNKSFEVVDVYFL